MFFNEYGLWRWTSNSLSSNPETETVSSRPFGWDYETATTQKTGYWSLLPSATEQDIFREIGMEFVDPTRRNFSYVTGKKRRTRTST